MHKLFLILIILSTLNCQSQQDKELSSSPNFLLLMSDNHYFSHLGCYGDPVVKTPNIDAIAKQGVRFTHAFCASPSCTPARSALLAGQDIWRLGEGANLHSTLSDTITTYVDVLKSAGYHVGHDRKGWGPGNYQAGGRSHNPAGVTYDHLEAFLNSNTTGRPWSYWLSSRNPHRPFDLDQGIKSGLDPEKVEVPPYLPDVPEVRSDICDYYLEVQDFDREVGEALALVKSRGELANTIIIVCGDNGWMMPRGLANLYDFGTRVPLIISWPDHFPGDRVIDDFVSLNDLAPTIIEAAALEVPDEYTASTLIPLLQSNSEGNTGFGGPYMYMARERHALCRQDGLGYPGRAIRSKQYLYIHNLNPERWPAGDPPLFGDIDLHMLHDRCPTKEYMMLHHDKPGVDTLYQQAFMKRPAEEFFDLINDPYQMNNLAENPAYQDSMDSMKMALKNYLTETKDPRALGQPIIWDTMTYQKEKDWIGTPSEEMRKKFGLKKEYSYR